MCQGWFNLIEKRCQANYCFWGITMSPQPWFTTMCCARVGRKSKARWNFVIRTSDCGYERAFDEDHKESLVLACTHCGGKHAISASEEISVIFLILFLWARGWRIVWRYSSRFKTGPHLSHCMPVSTLIYYQAIGELSGLKVPPMLFLPMRSEF